MFHKGFLLLILFMILFTVGCDRISPPEPTPIPTRITEDARIPPVGGGSKVVASGEVVPLRTVDLSFETSGRVESVEIVEDEYVIRDQLLAQLEEQPALEAALIAAELEQQKILDAAVIAAEMEVLIAQQALDALMDDNNLAQASAFQEIVDANNAIGDTQYSLFNLTIPAEYAGIDTRMALEITKEELDAAREAFEPYRFKPSGDQIREDLKEAVERARSDFNAILRLIELEATLKTAYANLEHAEKKYEILSQGPDPDEVALAEARLANAEAQVAVAREAAKAHQVNAEAQLNVARQALESIYLYAPIDGSAIVVDILPGERVIAGEPVITIADLSVLQVETTDLSERDVADIAVGQQASVYVEALNLDVPGHVKRISPQAKVIGGDVVYTVLIELAEQPASLRWGMTVVVSIETE